MNYDKHIVKTTEIEDLERPGIKATIDLVDSGEAAGFVVRGLDGYIYDPMVLVEVWDGQLRFLVYSNPDDHFAESETHEIAQLAPAAYT